MTSTTPITGSMIGITLPGQRRIERREIAVPRPGAGQVLVRVEASSVCGSDIRAIYREHLGVGAEAYQGVIAGHEPAGQVVALGPGVRELAEGDRVAVYHIAGCGQCSECRHGYHIGCHSPYRAAYGWQRDGGHAPYLLAEAVSCIRIPDSLSFTDGALVSCGFGTSYEGLTRARVSGADSLLVTGLGPVGLAAAMLGRALGAGRVLGSDISPARAQLALDLGLVDDIVTSPGDFSPVSVAIDCSGNAEARLFALQSLDTWGRCVYIGEGSSVSFDVSPLLIHKQVTLYGSWVTSLRHMADLLDRLDAWELRPETIVTDRYTLDRAEQAYEVADKGNGGKVCLYPHGVPAAG